MKYSLVASLHCPRTGARLLAYGVEVQRGQRMLTHLSKGEMEEGDEIVIGILIESEGGHAYPIVESIATLLTPEDADPNFLAEQLGRVSKGLPEPFGEAVARTLEMLKRDAPLSEVGAWNRGEIEFFDRDVATPELREKFFHRIRTEPIWNLYIPRERHIVRLIRGDINGKAVLEIGCGNARTISWLLPPSHFHYQYVGTDISFKRLLLAKAVIPEGDFIQCSALNLPFVDSQFYGVFSFGVFHHLPDPLAGLRECSRLLHPGGFLAFHEPIKKKGVLRKRKENVHDREIDFQQACGFLEKHGFIIMEQRFELSAVGTIAQMIIDRFSLLQKKRFPHIAAWAMDRFFIGTAARIVPRLGPAGILVVARKEKAIGESRP